MTELDLNDLKFSVMRLPLNLKKLMIEKEWAGSVFVGGGYIRSIITNEPINDIDVFVKSQKDAELLALKLAKHKEDIHKTDNAYTIKGSNPPVQIIHRWTFDKPSNVADSFDFTICCAVIYYESFLPAKMNSSSKEPELIERWGSFCDDRFYADLAGKRIVYRSPIRNEDAGGSMLRVLKYYQKGYRIPLDSLGAIIARLLKDFDPKRINFKDEAEVGRIITGLLREVDPDIDPTHASHLPSAQEIINEDNK